VENKYLARNQSVAQETEIALNEIRADLFVAASVPPIQGIIRAQEGGGYDREGQTSYDEWVKRLQDIYRAMATAYQRYLQTRFLDENGDELVRVDWDGQQARPIPSAELQNKADRPYFQETMKLASGQVYVSPLDLNQEWGRIVIPYQPTIRLATPIFNRQGERRGIVIINVLGQAFLHQPRTLPEEESSFVFLTDQRGYYAHHSAAPEKEWGNPEDLNTGHSLWADFPQVAGQILTGQAGEVYSGPWAIFYTPVPVDRERGAFLVLGQVVPHSLIQASVNRFLLVFSGVLALSLFLAVGTGYYLSRRVTAPLEALRQGARQIAGGQFDQRVQAGGSVEITDLADDFNRMAGQLAELYDSLQAEYKHLFESASDSIFIHDLNGRFLAVNENAARRLGYTREELLRLSVQDIDTPEAAARIEANLRLLEERGSLVFESAHRRKDGSVMPVEISATLVEHRGQQVVMSFVRDITERKQAEEALHHALAASQQRQAEIAALLEGSRAVLTYRDFQEAARVIFDACKRLVGATGGYVALLTEDGTENEVLFLDSGGRPCTVDPSLPMPIRGLREVAYRTGRAVHHNDFRQSEWVKYMPKGHVALDNILFAPLVIEGKTVGLLGLANKPGGFTDHDADMATAFGELVAIALYNSRTLESLEASQAETARRNAELAAQNVIAAAISQSLDLDTLLNAALDEVLKAWGMEAGGILLMDPGGETMTLRVHRGLQGELLQALLRLRPGEGISGQAVAQRKPVVLHLADYPTGRLAPFVHQEGFQTFVSTPLVVKEQVHGVLTLGTRRPQAFPARELDLLAAIGQQIGVAVENARLHEQVKVQRVEEQATLLRLSQEFLATLDPQEIMQRAVVTAAEALHADCSDLMLLGEDKKSLTLGFSHGREYLIGQLQLPNTDDSFPGYIVRRKTPVIVEDVANDGRFQIPAFIRECGVASALGVPVIAGEKAIGALIVDTQTPRLFTPEEAHFLNLIANQTGMALEQARAEAAVQRHAQEMAALYAIAATVSRSLDLERMLNDALDEVLKLDLLRGEAGVKILLLDEKTGMLVPSVGRRLADDHPCQSQPVKVGECLCGLAAEQGRLIVCQNASQDERHSRNWPTMPFHKDICVPLKAKDKVLGVLCAWLPPTYELREHELALMTAIGDQVGVAIENAYLFEETKRRAGELSAIGEVGGLVTAGGDLQVILDTLAEKIAQATGFEAVGIGLYDAEQRVLNYPSLYSTVTVGLLEGRKESTVHLDEAPVLQYLLREKRHLLIDDPQNDPRVRESQRELARRDGVQVVLVMPLLFHQEMVGVLDLITISRRVFSAEDMALLTTLADQVAVAIENARLYGQIEERARELSRDLIEQEQYAENVLQSIADGVYAVDRGRVVLSWSKGAEVITGYTAEEAIGRPCADFLRHTDEAGQVLCGSGRCPFVRVWASGKSVEPEQVTAHRKDGRVVPVAVTAAPIFDETGRSIGAVEVFRDVSKEVELLESIQAASRAKSEFLATMSHELRTPLNSIIGFSEVLQDQTFGPLNEKQARYVSNVLQSGRHLLQLINDVLDLAKVEAGKMELFKSEFPVAPALEGSLAMFRVAASKKSLTLELSVAPEVITVVADDVRFKQIMFNLLSNAVKFTPEGGRIVVKSQILSPKSELLPSDLGPWTADYLAVSVDDTGIGLAPEDVEHIWREFEQVESSYARQYGGTGLGLPLTKRLVELHGGRIWAESAGPGQGSTFTFVLPL
jgi:PAS domain S-box-containing protein